MTTPIINLSHDLIQLINEYTNTKKLFLNLPFALTEKFMNNIKR